MTRTRKSAGDLDDLRRAAFQVVGDLMAGVIDRANRHDLETLLRLDSLDLDSMSLLHVIAVAGRVDLDRVTFNREAKHASAPVSVRT